MADLIDRAIKQVRHATKNLDNASQLPIGYRTSRRHRTASKVLTVFANSMEFYGPSNRPQVEAALADYFDSLEV